MASQKERVMTKLVWDDGMSVGIEAIDDDHKQLIAILAKLMSAEEDKLSEQEISDIFFELERYTLTHFAREEALLEKISYKKIVQHKESHQRFIDKIPKLKQKWFDAENHENHENDDISPNTCNENSKDDIINFLQQWLVNHILQDDLDYVEAVCHYEKKHKNTESYTPSFPFLSILSNKLSKHLKLSQRVFITTLLPVVAAFILCLVLLNTNYQRYKNIDLVLGLSSVVEEANAITHSLQLERGLSSGYVSSNFQRFYSELVKRRKVTDEKIASFILLLEHNTKHEIKAYIENYTIDVKQVIKQLSQHRQHVELQSMTVKESNSTYTGLIEVFFSLSEKFTHVEIDVLYINDFYAINALLLFKELTGQMRAIGIDMIENGQENIYSNTDVTLLIGRQINLLMSFNNTSNKKQKKLCAQLCNHEAQQNFLESSYRQALYLYRNTKNDRDWFTTMSQRIDELNYISEQLIADFNKEILEKKNRIEQRYYFILMILFVFFLVALFFALVLNYSIISPVRKLTTALNKMSEGQNDINFHHITTDEIGAMKQAYEKLRRKILQGDIYKARVSHQQKEIVYRKSQQDHFQHMALTDALTGAVNRHYFNAALGKEIISVNEHGRPLSIMLLDIDHFKNINDRYGHGVGDEVLIMFYRTCKEAVRNSDIVARIGGEEFVVVMPGTELKDAENFAERLRSNIAKLKIKIDDHDVSLTVSIGVSQWQADKFINAETFVAHADKSLYLAKNSGRNKVVVA